MPHLDLTDNEIALILSLTIDVLSSAPKERDADDNKMLATILSIIYKIIPSLSPEQKEVVKAALAEINLFETNKDKEFQS